MSLTSRDDAGGGAGRITTERLVLRRPEPGDLPAVFEMHAEVLAALEPPGSTRAPLEAARALLDGWSAHWAAHGFGTWVVEERGADAGAPPIGFAGLRWRAPDELPGLNLYYRLRPDSRGRGYATEAARAVIRFGLEELRAPEVTAIVHADNPPSARVAERAGMSRAAEIEHLGAPAFLYAARAAP
jgi:RimJ/RimL family protein N-acetyltransferase